MFKALASVALVSLGAAFIYYDSFSSSKEPSRTFLTFKGKCWTSLQKKKIEEAIDLVQRKLKTTMYFSTGFIDSINDIDWTLSCSVDPQYLSGVGEVVFLADKLVNTLSIEDLAKTLMFEKIKIWQRKFPSKMSVKSRGYEQLVNYVKQFEPNTNDPIYLKRLNDAWATLAVRELWILQSVRDAAKWD